MGTRFFFTQRFRRTFNKITLSFPLHEVPLSKISRPLLSGQDNEGRFFTRKKLFIQILVFACESNTDPYTQTFFFILLNKILCYCLRYTPINKYIHLARGEIHPYSQSSAFVILVRLRQGVRLELLVLKHKL